MPRRKVILITDGDRVARETVEDVARQVGGRCISASAGNPTPLTGEGLVELIQQAAFDPVLVMFDDSGSREKGRGEQALEYVINHPDIEVIGVVAVASNSHPVEGTPVHVALDRDGNVVEHGVDKDGVEMGDAPLRIFGDTVDVLNQYTFPMVVGIGDVGKMSHHDDIQWGAPVTAKAVRLILEGNKGEGNSRVDTPPKNFPSPPRE
ncbi:stage V sporulation protein AE [Melghirimyces profundicolus]|uniref:Stage V sporulation protein AE n=1 Tax=Melghirimyces profundicolus TaxID=1242148 RepID=A0A2T6B465_9BACL|nr:stage V sporulation protein AE [Melghirimyces profundicolus]PTX50869.1 stage V sporulation protein AE [Melghirimyces profundicolus]